MGRSLRARLGAALAAVAVLSVAVTAVISAGLVRRSAEDAARRDLARMAEILAGEQLEAQVRLPLIRRMLEITGDRIAVVGPRGQASGDAIDVARAIDLTPMFHGERIEGSVRAGGVETVYVGVPVRLARPGARPAPGVAGVILARPVGIARDLWGPIAGRVLLAAAGAVLVALAVSAVVAARLARPVSHLREAASRIARGDLEQRVPVDSDDEIGDLARSFNDMSVALEESQRREREFLASVSHELRTPLTAIRGYVEALEDGAVEGEEGRAHALGVIRGETGRLERLVADVMDLARLGSRAFTLEPAPCDLGDVVREAVSAHGAIAAEGGVTLEAGAPEPLPAVTDAGRVRQVVTNLVENALRVTPRGGNVRVHAAAADGAVAIEVSDTGPGIGRDDLPHVFERSYLWRTMRGEHPVGTGLGLAIVRELVEALGGRIEVRSEVGSGTMFRVTVPTDA